ncbi:sigma-54-dependent transcriptional regulator [Desulfococcus sp.]|uniref:sigma-54-dependent transcriptional regulator n=1 Tax=Desulfococcus sp. TaxID=2025834 RepID=UPI0035939F0E
MLIIDDEENMRHMLAVLLSKLGYQVDTAADGAIGLRMIKDESYDFILCDLNMPHMGGMDFLRIAKDDVSNTTVIVMSAYGSIDTALDAMKLGAYDYISKPFKTDEVYLALKKAEERESLRRENLQLKERIRTIESGSSFARMIGKSDAMQAVFRLARKAAQYDATVLISGESGTGKELIARGVHFEGCRSGGPFVAVNCGGIPENLLESEFFGYKKGAFTGADKNRKGLFENAEGGTLFLDEIGELPLSLQVKFLRVLQENEIRPIGDSKTRPINARIIAATSKDLQEGISRDMFRQDLFYRLNVLPITIPPLRERPDDIPLLTMHFIDRVSRSMNKDIHGISKEAMPLLLRHSWPGNVRELENSIKRAAVLADETILTPDNFPFLREAMPGEKKRTTMFEGYSLKEAQKMLEKHLITKALEETGGNRTKAIQLLEISHPSLLSKIKAYDIAL